jgi:hypothetical protein
MGQKILVSVGEQALEAELNDSPAAARLSAALPHAVRMSRWGEEYYGSLPLDIREGPSARELMEVGEIAYWPPGKALCFFFGPTPASTDDRPRAASPVVPLGRFVGEVASLKALGSNIEARLTAAGAGGAS